MLAIQIMSGQLLCTIMCKIAASDQYPVLQPVGSHKV